MSSNSITILNTSITHPTNTYTQQQITKAEQYTLWSWYDCMTALNEIGYDPSQQEKERILQALFIKKLKHIGAQHDS